MSDNSVSEITLSAFLLSVAGRALDEVKPIVMYLSEPASFDDVLAVLANLEKRINGPADG
jgi:hypothetical protein